jgi:hypothetical protein
MESEKSVEVVDLAVESNAGKKPYEQPRLVEHGLWTEKTLPPIGGSGF